MRSLCCLLFQSGLRDMADRRIRLLVVGVEWPAETFIYNLLKELAKNNIEIAIATVKKCRDFQDKDFRLIPLFSFEQPLAWRMVQVILLFFTKVLRYPKEAVSFWMRTAYLARPWKRIYFFIHKLLPMIGERFDIIHFHWISAATQYLPFYELLKAKMVISCRGSQINIAPYNPKRKDISAALLRECFKKADAIHCVSEAMKKEILKYTDQERIIYVIRPAVDTEFFSPPSKKQSYPQVKIVSVGNLNWKKGYEYGLAAIRDLLDRGLEVSFTIVGEGQERQRILYTIFDLELSKDAELLGHKSQDEIREILGDGDIFLLSSLSEGISNAALEAMACALPVVTTDCGGMREAVRDGLEGFVVPVRDTEAIAAALKRLIEDARLRQEMGQQAREKIKRDFSLERQVKQFIQLYGSLRRNQNNQ